jgi:uncharacterized RDD family membrane protein YckC
LNLAVPSAKLWCVVEPNNPYEPPLAEVNLGLAGDAPRPLLNDASMGARFLNMLIDTVVRRVMGLLVGNAAATALGLTGRWEGVALSLGALFLYYVVFEATFGWTLGKLVTGTRVVDDKGGKPTFGQICGRTLARFIPFEPLSFFGSSLSGWHDKLSHTRVVRVRR